MKLDLSKIEQQTVITIQGNELWLSELYAQFPVPNGCQSRPLLKAELTVSLQDPSEYIHVSGELRYEPLVDCSRCADSITWPVNAAIDEYFRRGADPKSQDSLVDLELSSMEDNFLADDHLDIASLLNEVVQLALPTQLVKTSADGSRCEICLKDISSAVIHSVSTGENDSDQVSPFAVLKDLKLDS